MKGALATCDSSDASAPTAGDRETLAFHPRQAADERTREGERVLERRAAPSHPGAIIYEQVVRPEAVCLWLDPHASQCGGTK
jgi:hypothetical protein